MDFNFCWQFPSCITMPLKLLDIFWQFKKVVLNILSLDAEKATDRIKQMVET